MSDILWIVGTHKQRAPCKFPKCPQGGSTTPIENYWAKCVSHLGIIDILGPIILCLVPGGVGTGCPVH